MRIDNGVIIGGTLYTPAPYDPRKGADCTICALRDFCDSQKVDTCKVSGRWGEFRKRGRLYMTDDDDTWQRTLLRAYGERLYRDDMDCGEVSGIFVVPRSAGLRVFLYTLPDKGEYEFLFCEVREMLRGEAVSRTGGGCSYKLEKEAGYE